jgi:hypothetical protein
MTTEDVEEILNQVRVYGCMVGAIYLNRKDQLFVRLSEEAFDKVQWLLEELEAGRGKAQRDIEQRAVQALIVRKSSE